jgi:hypothetical protein
LLQQRPSTGWGAASESAATDIKQFLAKAIRANKGFKGTPGQLAQMIQRSAFPARYDQREQEVSKLIGGGINGAQVSSSPDLQPTAPSGNNRIAFMQEMLRQTNPSTTRPDYRKAVNISTSLSAHSPEYRQPQSVESPQNPSPGRNEGGGLLDQLRRLGVSDAITSGERSIQANRATGGSPTSYHLPGGPSAYDLNPADPQARSLIAYARKNPGYFKEFFYDPLGWYIKNGKVIKGKIGGHGDHIHAAR